MKKYFNKFFIRLFTLIVSGIFTISTSAHAQGGGLGNLLGNLGNNLINGMINAVNSAITGTINGVINGIVTGINAAITGFFTAIFGAAGQCTGAGTVGDIICNFMTSIDTLPGFVTAMSYLLGTIMAITALLKLKDHVLSPDRNPLSDSLKRFLAGGALFSLPTITGAIQDMISGGINNNLQVSGYAGSTSGGGGLDTMMVALFQDLYSPMMGMLFSFGYIAGLILTVVGIMRIIKTAQDGPRGPAGLGTIMTFVVAGVLFSSGTIMQTFSESLFGDSTIATFAILNTSSGDAAVDDHILAVISTVLVFMTIVGWISFIRGFFILRDVAEGNGQASLMVSLTHMFGGALAVNLGPLLNAVQSTFGLTAFGVSFT